MKLVQELLAIETDLWTGDSGVYRRTLVEEALLLVPYQVLDRDQTITEIDAAPRWDRVDIEEPQAVLLSKDSAVVAYRGTGYQGDGTTYTALVSSTYVRRDGAWRLAFHHQTPVPETTRAAEASP